MDHHLALKSDAELLQSITELARQERNIVANVIGHLVAIEERGAHLELAYESLTDFCVRGLNMSDSTARRRVRVTQLVRRYPVLLEAFQAGKIHMSAILAFGKILTPENVNGIVAEASGKTTKQVRELVARIAPKPDVPTTIERQPLAAGEARAAATVGGTLAPLSPDRYCLQTTVSGEICEMIERAKDLMRHCNPSGDLEVILHAALKSLIKDREKQRFGKTDRPRTAKPSKDPGYVTRATRREVFARDGEQCTFVSEDGVRCTARAFLEIDHRDPRAKGGKGTAENSRVFCSAHNKHAARKAFGRELVEQRIRARKSAAEARLLLDDAPTLPELPLFDDDATGGEPAPTWAE